MQRRRLLTLSAALVALSLSGERALAQDNQKPFTAEQLDQLLAQIALYPDAVLSQVLMAATYPLEVVEAARWSKANPALKGDAAVKAVGDKDWDVSVKSLVAFPDALHNMDAHLDWTQKLGDAMIAQESDVADSIQRLRAAAAKAGNLQSTEQQTVTTEGTGADTMYIIQPANPQIVYVPSYNPVWAYGPWPYPSQPIYYPFGGALARGFMWGVGFAAAGAIFGGWNWNRGNSYTNINVNRATNIDRNFNRNNIGGDGRWQHRPEHRKGVGYRDQASRDRFSPNRPGAAQRGEFRGHQPTQRPGGLDRPGGQGPGANRPGGDHRPGGGAQNRPAQRPTPQQRGNQRPNAMSGSRNGGQVNRQSQRGNQQMNRSQQNHGGGNRGGGGGGGARGGGGGGGRGGGGRR